MRQIKYKMYIKETGETLKVGRICIQCETVYPWDQLDTFYKFDQVDLFEWTGEKDKSGEDVYKQL